MKSYGLAQTPTDATTGTLVTNSVFTAIKSSMWSHASWRSLKFASMSEMCLRSLSEVVLCSE